MIPGWRCVLGIREKFLEMLEAGTLGWGNASSTPWRLNAVTDFVRGLKKFLVDKADEAAVRYWKEFNEETVTKANEKTWEEILELSATDPFALVLASIKAFGPVWQRLALFPKEAAPDDSFQIFGVERANPTEADPLFFWVPETWWAPLWSAYAHRYEYHSNDDISERMSLTNQVVFQSRLLLLRTLQSFGELKDLTPEHLFFSYNMPLKPQGVSSADVERSSWLKSHGSKLGHASRYL